MARASGSATGYPRIYPSNWWAIRRAVSRNAQASLTSESIATILDIEEPSARNVPAPFRSVGLIDEDGKLTDLGHQWRDDGEYANACQKILEALYPAELLHVCPPPAPDPEQLRRWFQRTAKVGEGAAKMMARFYQLLCRQDPSEGKQESANGAKSAKPAPSKQRTPARTSTPEAPAKPAAAPPARSSVPSVGAGAIPSPTVNVAVQVYITPEASTEQIDQVFASMAKHIYRTGAQGDGQ